jgi:pimeloyl-ACP methyl ester carboxylesterase
MPDSAELVATVTGGRLPRERYVHAGALRLHCLEWGDGDAPSVLLVHGNGGHAHWWDPLVPYLADAFRLIAPDLRGHGESSWPTDPAYGIADFSDDLLVVTEQLAPGRVAIIAHSMGARVAAWFTDCHPDRVRGLALLDTSIAGVDVETAQRWRGRVVGRREGRSYGSYQEAVAAFRFVPPEDDVSASIVADLAHHAVVERRPGDWTFRFDRAVLAIEGDGAGDLRELVARLTCPLWIGRGAASPVIRRNELRRIAERRSDIEVHDFPGAHHFFLAHPAPAGAALRRFLDRL